MTEYQNWYTAFVEMDLVIVFVFVSLVINVALGKRT